MITSPLAGETLAMADAMNNGIFSSLLDSELMTEIVHPERPHILLVTDCQSLHDNSTPNKAVSEKRLRLEIAAIKEAVNKKLVKDG